MIKYIVASTTTRNSSSLKIPAWATPPLEWSGEANDFHPSFIQKKQKKRLQELES